MDIPTVGRIVHYVSHGTPLRPDGTQAYTAQCRAAIVTQIGDVEEDASNVGLCVLNPTGFFFHEDAMQDESGHSGGSWHWPERISIGH